MEKEFLNKKRNKSKSNEINESDDNKEINQLKNNLNNYENVIDELKEKNEKLEEENSKLLEELKKYKNKKYNENIKEKTLNINKFAVEKLSNISFNFIINKNEQIELIGLKEIKEAPFINSILQCFLNTSLLSKYFLYEYKSSIGHKLSHQYFNLINQIKNKQNNISNEIFIEYGNDYKDFISNFLNKMYKELKINGNKSIIEEIFQGENELVKINGSNTFNFENTKSNPKESKISRFYHIDFDIKDFITNNSNNSKILNNEIKLKECFNTWREKNMKLNNENYIYKLFRIKTCPKVLILIFERIDNDNIKILFKEKFDITNNTFFYKNGENKKIIYKLYSIITKRKNENHFVSFCLNYNEQKWYKYDDNKEKEQITFQEIVNFGIPLILFCNLEN